MSASYNLAILLYLTMSASYDISLRYLSISMFRLRAAGKAQADGPKKHRTRDRAVKAFPAPEANAELQSNIDVRSSILFYPSFLSVATFLLIIYFTIDEKSA